MQEILWSNATDFSMVTELPGNRASLEQLRMIYTRYRLAHDLCEGKDVLEAACGPGRGLGYLSTRARSIMGGDFTEALVNIGNAHYRGRLRIIRLDAESLPFEDASFDVVILFEALYYLSHPRRFFSEARRVLRPGGLLLISTSNKDWAEFNPSPHSVGYHSAKELREALEERGFSVTLKAGFMTNSDRLKDRVITLIRRFAVSVGLIPKTMKGKAWLKRLFYGKLAILGPEIDTSVLAESLVDVSSNPVRDYKIIYAIARKA